MNALTHHPDHISPNASSELHRALDSFTKALAAKVSSSVDGLLSAHHVPRKSVEHEVAKELKGLLELEFIAEFLVDEKSARQRRALLVHVLSGAELESLEGGRSEGLAERTTDSGDDELTSEAAADLLHVSRTHLNKLADSGQLGETRRTEGRHRRISKAGVLKYKAESKQRQVKGLTAMMEASQRLGLYEDELAQVPSRAKR